MIRNLGIVSLSAMLLLAGCSPERKLAHQYVKHHKGNGIMIIPLYELFKDNLTLNYDTAVKYTPAQFDAMAWAQSTFIQHVSDSVFLTQFTNSMINELNAEGYDVYVDGSSDIFFSLPDPKWVVQVAQLQLNEEHRYDFYEMYSVQTGEPYYDSLKINNVNLASWLEVSRANTDKKQVLYLEGYIEDAVKRAVDLNFLEGSVGLQQFRDSIGLNDIYKIADELGRKHAELLFDYFMNDYIRKNLPDGIVHRQYFRFDRKSKSVKEGLKEKFEVVQ